MPRLFIEEKENVSRNLGEMWPTALFELRLSFVFTLELEGLWLFSDVILSNLRRSWLKTLMGTSSCEPVECLCDARAGFAWADIVEYDPWWDYCPENTFFILESKLSWRNEMSKKNVMLQSGYFARWWEAKLAQLMSQPGNFLYYMNRVSHPHYCIMIITWRSWCVPTARARVTSLAASCIESIISIGTEVESSAKLVATCFNDTMGKRKDLDSRSCMRWCGPINILVLVQEN
jgi:hypothetical protein